MDLVLQFFVDWLAFLVPALAVWAVIGIHVYRSDFHQPTIDAIYFAAMLVIGALTWRTMSGNDSHWLVHTASLGIMIVGGVMHKRDNGDEQPHLAG